MLWAVDNHRTAIDQTLALGLGPISSHGGLDCMAGVVVIVLFKYCIDNFEHILSSDTLKKSLI